MPTSLIRGKYVICGVVDRHEATIIEDGAVFQRDGVIVDIGAHEALAARHRADTVIGSADDVVIPGLVNSHHHIGLTPIQLGSRDYALELWLATLIAGRTVDPYLDTLYSAFEMIESGVTTVQHLQVWVPRPVKHVESVIARVLDAYRDVGMRVSFSPRAARSESACLRERRRLPATASPRARRRARRLPGEAYADACGADRTVRGHVGEVRGSRSHPHPARAVQPALVFGPGAGGDAGAVREVSGAHAHAPAGDRLAEGVRAAPGAGERPSTTFGAARCSGR